MKTRQLLCFALLITICITYSCAPKYGCPASNGGIGAEKAMDQKKTSRYSKKLRKF